MRTIISHEQSPEDEYVSSVEAPAFYGGAEYMTWTTGRLVIPNAKAENSGKYTCAAETDLEKVTESFTIVVESNEDFKGSYLFHLRFLQVISINCKSSLSHESIFLVGDVKDDVLRIDQISNMIYQDENKPLYAVCRATQGRYNPTPTIRWYLGSTELTRHDSPYGVKVSINRLHCVWNIDRLMPPVMQQCNYHFQLHDSGDLEVSRATADFHWMQNNLLCKATSSDGSQTVSESVWVYMLINDN